MPCSLVEAVEGGAAEQVAKRFHPSAQDANAGHKNFGNFGSVGDSGNWHHVGDVGDSYKLNLQHKLETNSCQTSRRRFAFVQVDVFTSVPLEGNQLAVFPDARGMSDAEMQSVAKEMNLSETTFIFPGDIITERERGVRVRIFTVNEELPFAGHPTLGTAMVLRGEYCCRRNCSGSQRGQNSCGFLH